MVLLRFRKLEYRPFIVTENNLLEFTHINARILFYNPLTILGKKYASSSDHTVYSDKKYLRKSVSEASGKGAVAQGTDRTRAISSQYQGCYRLSYLLILKYKVLLLTPVPLQEDHVEGLAPDLTVQSKEGCSCG